MNDGGERVDATNVKNLDLSGMAVAMKGITKRFPGTLALDNVDFTLQRGERSRLADHAADVL